MIVNTKQLVELRGLVTMVDGSFDPIHEGHIAYFKAASDLGFPVFCNIASDVWTKSKHEILLSQSQRAIVIDSVRYVDFVYLCETSSADILEKVVPKIYAKGSDWQSRGGVPRIEKEICESLDIEIKYLDTVLNSSSGLLNNWKNSSNGE